MSSIVTVNRTLVYLLIFTIITSAIAFTLVVKAYDSVYQMSSGEFF